ncbi:MAG: hypothetical protein HN712_20700 [Gemmatimonadetes bacterium]|mgnify:CR=1 FL=1|nr:hypothetical protein [Gemmatimonadota bacterium]MBT7862747.1 hypothetical protein [Gemmatimonadota bacterium]
MRSIIFAVAAVCMVMVATAAAQPQAVDLELDKASDVSFTDAGHGLSLTWAQVTDSRCPTDAVCVWAGEVEVRLAVVPTGREGTELVLRLPARDGIEVSGQVDGYTIRLDSVTPAASLETPPTAETYRAHLTVAPPGTLLPKPVTAIGDKSWGQMKLKMTSQ